MESTGQSHASSDTGFQIPRLAIVIPAYNEADRLGPSLERVHAYYSSQPYTWQVIVVSDGSTDATDGLVIEFAKSHPEFKLMTYKPNRGKGYAVRHGMLAAKGELLLFCDADLATPQEETPKLLEAIESGFPVAIGSRPLAQSNLEIRQPFYREWLGRAFNGAVQLLAAPGIHDTQCGFKMFTSEAAIEIFSRCKLDGFSFDFEALAIARDLDLKIAEIPIRWRHQEGSKVSVVRDGLKMLVDLVKLRALGKRGRLKLNSDQTLATR